MLSLDKAPMKKDHTKDGPLPILVVHITRTIVKDQNFNKGCEETDTWCSTKVTTPHASKHLIKPKRGTKE